MPHTYTLLTSRQYLNLNVHINESKVFNVGIVRIDTSFSAENYIKPVQAKEMEFDTNFTIGKCILMCVNDDNNMMVLFVFYNSSCKCKI